MSHKLAILMTDHPVRGAFAINDSAFLIQEGALEELEDDPIARKHYLGEDFRM